MQDKQKSMLFSLVLILCAGYVLSSFIPGIVWGAILALSLWPVAEKLNSKYAPIGLTVGVLIAFIVPLIYVGIQIAAAYYLVKDQILTSKAAGFVFPEFLNNFPFADKLRQLWETHIQNSENLKNLVSSAINGPVLSKIPTIGGEISSLLVLMLCAIVCMYFLLKNKVYVDTAGPKLVENVLGLKAKQAVLNGLSAVRGTINGVVVVGLIEGAILSVPLVLGGIQAGLLIGFTAGILGVIPMVLPLLIFPCAVYLYLQGSVLLAALTVSSMLVVWFVFENIYKPKLISDAVKVHPLIVLIALIGGLQTLGALGLFIGPAIVASTISIIAEYTKSD